ncbi:Uncharacterized protein HZ326_19800 [Fusarium oxysporum f. sp. albedinis]|nr:Uncharacterized protein HZ326_19800 [Fusarium oxysporum f. sp. albedinis]
MASMSIQYNESRVGLVFWLSLGKVDLLEPLDCDMVVRPAVLGRDIMPVSYLLELIDKPLLLKLIALEDNSGLQKMASCCDGLDKASPSAGLGAFEEGLPLGIAAADNQRIQAYIRNGSATLMAKSTETHQTLP